MVVRQIFPGVPVRAIIFAHRAPGTFAEIGPPALPALFPIAGFRQPDFLLRHILSVPAELRLSYLTCSAAPVRAADTPRVVPRPVEVGDDSLDSKQSSVQALAETF